MQQMQPQSRAVDVEQYGSEIQVVFSQVYLLDVFRNKDFTGATVVCDSQRANCEGHRH